ncbi:hypothetical protein OG301_14915 [Streptomyces platensis]|uniref:hypothetical protein n=1 Tax=Streptomyces platensis TaxID=58346 RepID=UPI002ED68292|nr:hypothetical protein OG301_14915 [Streptomyces platensis]
MNGETGTGRSTGSGGARAGALRAVRATERAVRRRRRRAAAALVLCLALAPALLPAAAAQAAPYAAAHARYASAQVPYASAPYAAADGKPTVRLSAKEAGKGGSVTVTGRGWRPKALLTLLICGQNMIGGTNACANGDGRAVTTDTRGAFRRKLPVAEPPKPCPCVVHVATVTGAAADAEAPFKVAGHPVAPLPKERTGGRLAVVTQPRLTGSSNLLTWFGAPAQRELRVTVGNLGSAPAKDPVFQVGTSHGVFAPQWAEQQWRGTVPAGKKAEVRLPVELPAGAHGDYLVSLKYGGKVLVEQPWGVGRPWGVTLFWVLLCVVVPTAVFRIGMAVVDRVRPHLPGRDHGRSAGRPRPAGRTRAAGRPPGAAGTGKRIRNRTARERAGDGTGTPDDSAALPWFTPDTAPSTTTSTERPTSKGSA